LSAAASSLYSILIEVAAYIINLPCSYTAVVVVVTSKHNTYLEEDSVANPYIRVGVGNTEEQNEPGKVASCSKAGVRR
jgi:hypothetical protein